MSVLIVNFHQTVADAASGGMHSLTDAEFDRQLQLMQDSALRVVSTREPFESSAKHEAHRLAITFDDGFKSDLKNAGKLARRGWAGTFFISTAHIGSPGYLAAHEIRELAQMGMTVGSHSHDHIRLTTIDPASVDQQIAKSRDILEQILGGRVDQFAFPGGAYSRFIVRSLIANRFNLAFGTAWGLNVQLNSVSACVLRRNNAIRGMSERSFLDLITLQGYRARQVKYWLRTAALEVLPESAYAHVRRAYLRSTAKPIA